MTIEELEQAVRGARRRIVTDGYSMSIGELSNLYREGELVIRPAYQRLFRWNDWQKSQLVESLLLGIPLPSIFVAQDETGTWELIDGLQRVSTVLQLQGLLADADPLVLQGTKFLPELEGRYWEHDDDERSLSQALRLDIKRTKLDIRIVKRDSSPEMRFDLFQRLNSYGSKLTSQEIRSAMLVAVSPEFFEELEALAKYRPFADSVQLTDRLVDERYDLELVVRFLVLHNRHEDDLTLSSLRDLPSVLDDASIELASNYPGVEFERLKATFRSTFDVIHAGPGSDFLRRWDPKRGVHIGPFLNSAFEIFALGLGYRIANGLPYTKDLVGLCRSFWSAPEMGSGFATGKSTEYRLSRFIPQGRMLVAG